MIKSVKHDVQCLNRRKDIYIDTKKSQDKVRMDENNVKKYPIIRVAGVPEHFNETWIIGIEENIFLNEQIQIEWH